MHTFEEYCKSKKINPELFQDYEGEKFAYLKNYFEQVHPDSFTSQKLFLINELRRTYLYTEPKIEEISTETISSEVTEEPKQNTPEKPKFGLPKIPKPSSEASSTPNAIIKPKIQVKSSPTEEIENEVKPALARPKISAMKPKIPSKPTENPMQTESSQTSEKKTALPKPKIPSLKPKLNDSNEENTVESPKTAILRPKIPSTKKTESSQDLEKNEEPKKAPILRPKIPPKKE